MLIDYFIQSFIYFAFIMCEAVHYTCVRVQESQEGISSLYDTQMNCNNEIREVAENRRASVFHPREEFI